MTHLKIELSTGTRENVSSNVITKLYDLAKEIELGNGDITLRGWLFTDTTYQDYVTYLLNLSTVNGIQQLIIDANKKYLIFSDPEVERILATLWGDGTGVTLNNMDTHDKISSSLFLNNTTIQSFNELGNFNTITKIDADAFNGCSNLTSIDLSNIQYIGRFAFYNSGLSSINLPSFINFNEIGSDYMMFSFAESNLTSITFGENYTGLLYHRGLFQGCTNLTTVSGLKTSPDNHIFPLEIFMNCYNLTSIGDIDMSHYTEYENECFYNCQNLVKTIDLTNVTKIGHRTFYNCRNITFTGDLSNLTTLKTSSNEGDYAFIYCKHLPTTLTFTKLVDLGRKAAFYDTNIVNVSLPNGFLTSIPQETFGSCASLTTVSLGNNVSLIGQEAFAGSGLTSIDLSSVTRINNSGFRGCTSLTTVTLGTNSLYTEGRVFLECSALTTINNANSITRLGEHAFNGCTSLGTGLTLELNLTNLDVYPHNALRGTKYTRLILHSPLLTGSHDGRYPLYEDMRDVTYIDLSDFLVGPSNDAPSYRSDSDFYNNNSLVTFIYPSNVNYIGASLSKARDISSYRYAIILATTPPGIKTDNSNNPPSEWFTSGNLHIYVPDSAKAAYLADADWSTIGGYNGSDTITDRLHGLSELPNGVWTTGLASLYLTAALLATS